MRYLKTYESFGMRKDICDRCQGPTNGITTMSVFNTDVICKECKEKEKKDPDYQLAQDAEAEAVRNGVYNYSGLIPNYKPIN